jgi:protein-tyrosine kinase
MSKLFEALTRGQEVLPDVIREQLMEGQTVGSGPAGVAEDMSGDVSPLTGEADVRSQPLADPDAGSPPAAVLDLDAVAGVRVLPLGVVATSPILPFDGTHRRAGEQYRLLRTRIAQHPKHPQMLVITSVGPADGKTVTVINVAGSLALKSEARVLILEGDFRRSTVSTQLGLPATPGLADVLEGRCQLNDAIIQAAQIPQLYILPAGTPHVNPSELLDSSAWASVCAACRAHFEYIVMDSPPRGAVADYDLLQAACDGVIVVVRPDYTDRQRARKALQEMTKDKLLGVVVNDVDGWLLDRDRNRYGAYYLQKE